MVGWLNCGPYNKIVGHITVDDVQSGLGACWGAFAVGGFQLWAEYIVVHVYSRPPSVSAVLILVFRLNVLSAL
jgi:hypothetical protein